MQQDNITTSQAASEVVTDVITTIRVPKPLWDDAKIVGIRTGRQLREVVIDGVRAEVERLRASLNQTTEG